ncbi:Urease accessory protein UreE [compost metagenome]
MIIHEIIGNVQQLETGNRKKDLLSMEWFETTKRIQRRTTQDGQEIAIKFLKEGQRLREGDILFMDDHKVVVVDIIPCEAIIVSPASLLEMGSVCYEIGNKHLPIFIQNDEVLLPYEEPIFRWLTAAGYATRTACTKLLNLLNATVQPHGHGGSSSLFSRIIGLTSK